MGLSKRGPPAGSQQPARPAPALPGFYNSFANAGTPTKPRHAAREKGKERFREPIAMDEDTFFAPPPERQRSPPSSPLGPGPVEPEDHPMEDLALSSQAVLEAEEQPQTQVEPEPEPVHEDEDVNMEGDNEEVVQDEAHEVEAPNWRDEVLCSRPGIWPPANPQRFTAAPSVVRSYSPRSRRPDFADSSSLFSPVVRVSRTAADVHVRVRAHHGAAWPRCQTCRLGRIYACLLRLLARHRIGALFHWSRKQCSRFQRPLMLTIVASSHSSAPCQTCFACCATPYPHSRRPCYNHHLPIRLRVFWPISIRPSAHISRLLSSPKMTRRRPSARC